MSDVDREYLDAHLKAVKAKTEPDVADDIFFEHFCARQILKSRDLDLNDLALGFIGGGTVQGRDGGADAVYFFCDEHLITDEMLYTDFTEPNVSLSLEIIQAKRETGFGEKAIEKFANIVNDLLDPGQNPDHHATTYSDELRSILKRFRQWNGAFIANGQTPNLKITFHYATKADGVDPEVQKKATQLEQRVKGLYPCECKVDFISATRLMAMVKETKAEKTELKFNKQVGSSVLGEAYICLVPLQDFVDFITVPETRERREYLLAPNVRNYLGEVTVNQKIQETLQGSRDAEFWWLNNGVTIVADKVEAKPAHFTLTRPRIVNGLQTSREIYNYARKKGWIIFDDVRHVMVRVVQAEQRELVNRIIKSTNNQTTIRPIYLKSTDEIHFKLEASFPGVGLHYERVINQWVDAGKPLGQIITFPYLMKALMATLLLAPNQGRGRADTFGLKEYEKLFKDDRSLKFYQNTAVLMKRVDKFVQERVALARDQRNLVLYVAMYACCVLCETSKPDVRKITKMDTEALSDEMLETCLKRVDTEYRRLIKQRPAGQTDDNDPDKVAKGAELVGNLKDQLSKEFPVKKGS